MSEISEFRFRTAVGGFNKSDVADYIAKTAAAHQAALKAQDEALEELREENRSLQEELTECRHQLEASENTTADVAPEDAAVPDAETAGSLELAAYRRAEAAERLADTRAKKIHAALDHSIDSTNEDFAELKASAQNILEQLTAQFNILAQQFDAFTAALEAEQLKIKESDTISEIE